ncbi:MAG: hypothetical protein QXT64_03765 [Desulfurococcaceae archaeon]
MAVGDVDELLSLLAKLKSDIEAVLDWAERFCTDRRAVIELRVLAGKARQYVKTASRIAGV